MEDLNNSNNNNEIRDLYIEDIIKIDPKKMILVELIQNQCNVAHYCQEFFEHINKYEINNEMLNDLLIYLEWMYSVSSFLANLIGQQLIPFRSQKIPIITRSSYDFCEDYVACKNFYNEYPFATCKKHHYVHYLLNHDLSMLINFLKHVIDEQRFFSLQNINSMQISLRTICYVTRHMSKEITYIYEKRKNEYFKYHRNNDMEQKKKNNKIIIKQDFSNKPVKQSKWIIYD